MNYRLMKGLKKHQNIELSAIVLNEGMLADGLRNLEIPVSVVDERHKSFFQIFRNVRNIIIQISPDIIHSHRLKENILAYFSSKGNKKIQLICTEHGMPEPINKTLKTIKNRLLLNYQYWILSRHFKHIIVVSKDMRNIYIEKLGFKNNQILYIHNGTEIPESNIMKNNGNNYVVGSAGRFFPIKDYPLMVEIAREVLQETGNVRFKLAGDGPEKERIISLIRRYGIEESFSLTGFIDNMAPFYDGLNLYINTSIHEGLPMSILEAMAHGLPVIAPNTGGIKEIIQNGIEGYLIDGRNPKMFAEKCIQLCEDNILNQKMGNASREKVINEYSLDKMAQNYYNLYSNVLEKC